MSIKNMHYDFKQKLNKIDSNKYRDLKVPEIDWKINEAMNLFIMLVAFPRLKTMLGFETTQATIDDIRSIVKDNVSLVLTKPLTGENYYGSVLPTDYLHYLSTAKLLATKGNCANKRLKTILIQHDDESNIEEFYSPSFEWRETNIRFYDGGIKIFTDGSFTINKFSIDYIRKPLYAHNAEAFLKGGYTLPDGVALTGSQDCELPEQTHREIVDIAVLLTTGDLELPAAYQFKLGKLKMNQLT